MSAPALAAAAAAAAAGLIVIGLAREAGAPRPARIVRVAAPGPLGRRRAGEALARRLADAGLALSPEAFTAAVLGCGVVAALVAAALLRAPIAGLVAFGTVVAAAAGVLGSADRRRRDRVAAQLPGVAQQLAAGLAAGLSLRQALARVARDAPEPARAEFARTAAALELGTRVDQALDDLAARVAVRDLRVMVTAIQVQRRTGGNLARALAALSERLQERAELARELQGATAQARMTAGMVAALPLVGGVVTEMAAPGTLGGALGQGIGLGLLIVSLILYGVGVLLIRRLGRVEP